MFSIECIVGEKVVSFSHGWYFDDTTYNDRDIILVIFTENHAIIFVDASYAGSSGEYYVEDLTDDEKVKLAEEE